MIKTAQYYISQLNIISFSISVNFNDKDKKKLCKSHFSNESEDERKSTEKMKSKNN